MLKAALKEFRTAPVTSIGALAGIGSFLVVLLGPTTVAQQPLASANAAIIAMAFVKVALVVPGCAFFFAFMSTLVAAGGPIRGLAASIVFFFVSCVFSACVTAVLLSPFTSLRHSILDTVFGIKLGAIAVAVLVATVIVFAGVLGEMVFSRIQESGEPFDFNEFVSKHDSCVSFVLFAALGSLVIAGYFTAEVFSATIRAL